MAIIFFFPFPLSFPFLVTTSENNSAMSFFFLLLLSERGDYGN